MEDKKYKTIRGKGDKAREQAEYEAALKLYKRALKLSPEDPEALKNLACVYGDLEKPEIAEKLYLKSLEINPTYWVSLNNLGEIYKKRKEFDKARQYLQKALNSKPDESIPYQNLGDIHYSLKKYARAFKFYTKAQQLCPNDPRIQADRAAALRNQNRLDECFDMLFEALEKSSNKHDQYYIYIDLALTYQAKNDYKDAIDTLKKAQALIPESKSTKTVLLYLAQNSYGAGNFSESFKYLQQSATYGISNPIQQLYKVIDALPYDKNHRLYDEAIQFYKELKPVSLLHEQYIQLTIAQIFGLHKNQRSIAIGKIFDAIELDPTAQLTYFYDCLATHFILLEQPESALEVLLIGFDDDPCRLLASTLSLAYLALKNDIMSFHYDELSKILLPATAKVCG